MDELKPKKKRPAYLDHAVSVLAFFGFLLMLYLLRLHFEVNASSVCDISARFSCGAVNSSTYSEIFGIPVALLGIFYFLAVPVALFQKKIKRAREFVIYFTIFSLVFSLYLSVVEFFIIGIFCLFCETSKALMVVILGILLWEVKAKREKLDKTWVMASLIVGLMMVGTAYVVQLEPEINEDFSPVAECLTENGVALYCTFWSNDCYNQQKAFGKALEKIRVVECDSRGKDPQVELCEKKNIETVPTWIQEKEGEEAGRLVGPKTVDELAREFGCTFR